MNWKMIAAVNRKAIAAIALFALSLQAAAQTPAQLEWHNPMAATGEPVVQNRLNAMAGDKSYRRLPSQLPGISSGAAAQGAHSAGLALDFYTNSPTIEVRYTLAGAARSMHHMPATGMSGLDLYATDANGKQVRIPSRATYGDTLTARFANLAPESVHSHGPMYHLYLPLYSEVRWLELGVEPGSEFRWLPARLEKPVVIYGTSIAQGACASRPGSAWTSVVERRLDLPVVNLGFSGSGLLEPPIISLMAAEDAAAYVLDCLPNLDNRHTAEVETLLTAAVTRLRESSQAPILLVDHCGFAGMERHTARATAIDSVNAACARAFARLTALGVKGLHHVSRADLAVDGDMLVDYVHLSDLGMNRMAECIADTLCRAMGIIEGSGNGVQRQQRREPDSYEWLLRHHLNLQSIAREKPRRVVMGNSITHYWGGSPQKQNGEASWREVMAPAGWLNLGCGWDRIENVLWRINHGELSGYEAEQVVILIGTNNLIGTATLHPFTDSEIVAALRDVARAARLQQPGAEITICGLLPRRGYEERIAALNPEIEQMCRAEGVIFADPGRAMTGSDGKIREDLFLDGLHPNDAGYREIIHNAEFIIHNR